MHTTKEDYWRRGHAHMNTTQSAETKTIDGPKLTVMPYAKGVIVDIRVLELLEDE